MRLDETKVMKISVSIKKNFNSSPSSFSLDASFNLEEDISVIFGASGSGKTLTLKAIAGLEEPDSGKISIEYRDLEQFQLISDLLTKH